MGNILTLILGIWGLVILLIGVVAAVADQWEQRHTTSTHIPYGPYERYWKRPLDAVLSAMALTVLSPLLLVTASLVRVKLGSPMIFKQERPGRNEKIFTLYKFRSMTDQRDKDGNLLPDTLRLTNFGKKLRSSSLDELPELWNILRGDMSIVGARPLLVRYLPRYNRYQARRHEIRPGFTGLAQVNGRNAISWEEKFKWDVEYVDHITFLGDWSIILKTVVTVLRREGINAEGNVTMPEFIGNGVAETEKEERDHGLVSDSSYNRPTSLSHGHQESGLSEKT